MERKRYEVKVDGKWVSRQRLQQMRNIARGRCQYCPKPATVYVGLCLEHAKYRRKVAREAVGSKPWREDERGYLEVCEARYET